MKINIIFVILTIITNSTFSNEFSTLNPIGYVNDFAKVMTEDEVKTLDEILTNYEKKSSVEIVLVTIDTLNGRSIEEYTINLAKKWKVGKKEKNNGLIILNSIKDKKWRIEVGIGLENLITVEYIDFLGNKILNPLLSQGKYFDAYKNTIESIIKKLDNPDGYNKKEKSGNYFIMILCIIILIVYILLKNNFLKCTR